jgi:hypothetical protein
VAPVEIFPPQQEITYAIFRTFEEKQVWLVKQRVRGRPERRGDGAHQPGRSR